MVSLAFVSFFRHKLWAKLALRGLLNLLKHLACLHQCPGQLQVCWLIMNCSAARGHKIPASPTPTAHRPLPVGPWPSAVSPFFVWLNFFSTHISAKLLFSEWSAASSLLAASSPDRTVWPPEHGKRFSCKQEWGAGGDHSAQGICWHGHWYGRAWNVDGRADVQCVGPQAYTGWGSRATIYAGSCVRRSMIPWCVHLISLGHGWLSEVGCWAGGVYSQASETVLALTFSFNFSKTFFHLAFPSFKQM